MTVTRSVSLPRGRRNLQFDLVYSDSAIPQHYRSQNSFDDARCDVLTFEIEHVDAATLEKLEKHGVVCEPKASTIMIIQVSISSLCQPSPCFDNFIL